MASAADLPQELFEGILYYVCEYARRLLDLGTEMQNRKEAIKDVAACSLTCIYWARTCRRRMFRRLWVKSYEDLCAFSQLVSSTPKTLTPLSEHVTVATLVQHIDDRPWIYLLRLHPSRFSALLRADYIHIHIIDSPDHALAPPRPTHSRLFARLPRAPPSLCHQCDALVLESPYFRTPNDVKLLLSHFSYRPGNQTLMLSNGTWAPGAQLHNNMLTRDVRDILPRNASITTESCAYSAETAWLAFCAILGRRIRYKPNAVSSYSAKGDLLLRVGPSAQQVILDTAKVICHVEQTASLRIRCRAETSVNSHIRSLQQICSIDVGMYKGVLPSLDLSFYASFPAIRATTGDIHRTPVDDIALICASIGPIPRPYPKTGPKVSSSSELQKLWQAMIGVFQRGDDMLLQLTFKSRDELIYFMEGQRAMLAELGNRVSLFHEITSKKDARAVNAVTLADIGAARDHGYIETFR